jgi:uncharacterized membrane protein (UPF0127 family)
MFRLKGLMFKKSLLPGEGILLMPCNSVHMGFMRFSLNLVFLSKEFEVMKVAENIAPWSWPKIALRAHAVLEYASAIDDLLPKIGERLEFRSLTLEKNLK